MHPALSVIVFTVSSGIGYGMLVWLAVNSLFGAPGGDALPWAAERGFGIAAFGLAFAAIVAGLLSSTLHLGHPERAWRALSQWRSSWLSREGVLAIATFVPTGLFAIGWVLYANNAGWWYVAGIAGALLCLATVFCTAMIYTSLRPIRAWNSSGVPVMFLLLSLASGAIWLILLRHVFGMPRGFSDAIGPTLLAVTAFYKFRYWQWIDRKTNSIFEDGTPRHRAAEAIGLFAAGSVRALDPPHTQANYLMKEMGFVVARRHSRKLRAIALGLMLVAALAAWGCARSGGLAIPVALLGALAMTAGLLIERWLFFAEAKHSVMLYYRGDQARA